MISAVKESNVYVLDYNEEHKVFSTKLDYVNRAGTSNAILREVLGIDTSIPFWAENHLKQIIREYLTKDFTQDNLIIYVEKWKKSGWLNLFQIQFLKSLGENQMIKLSKGINQRSW